MFYGHLTSVTDARSTAVIVASGTRYSVYDSRMPLLTVPYSKGNNCSRQPLVGERHITWPSVSLNNWPLTLSIQLLTLTYSLNGLQITVYCAQGTTGFRWEPHYEVNYPRPRYASLVLVPSLFREFQNKDLLHFSLGFSLGSLNGGCIPMPIEYPHFSWTLTTSLRC